MSTRGQGQARIKGAPAFGIGSAQLGGLQRKCGCGGSAGRHGDCEGCRAKMNLQRKAAGPSGQDTVPAIVREALRSSGQPLDSATRGFFEARFGHDFGQVRVHTDARTAESARAVHALAYTAGRDVVFGPGQYAPGTLEGRKLLAHELTHVIQQADRSQAREARMPALQIQRQADGGEPTEELPPTAPTSCECDCQSYCGDVATRYAQAHITYPSWFGEKPRPIRLKLVGTDCVYQSATPPCSWVCFADFESEDKTPHRVIVQLMGSRRFNVGTVSKSFPLCSYDFECAREGESGMKLTEVGCIERSGPRVKKMPGV